MTRVFLETAHALSALYINTAGGRFRPSTPRVQVPRRRDGAGWWPHAAKLFRGLRACAPVVSVTMLRLSRPAPHKGAPLRCSSQ